MDEIGKVSSEIVMSPPDTREEHSEVSEEEIPEILIVIDKLLTGFDAPKNTILYIDL